MDFIIVFFRDILDGPLYVVIAVLNSILICSCIGYLGEHYLNRKKQLERYNATFTTVSNTNQANISEPIPQEISQINNNQV